MWQYAHDLTHIIFRCKALVKDYPGVIYPVFKSLNIYLPKSTTGVVDPLKGPSSASMTCSENFRFNPNYVIMFDLR